MDFHRAARIDDALLVHTTWGAIKGPRMAISQTITRGSEVIATADVEAACITLEGKPCRPPPELIARLAPYLLGDREG
jgi:acyl-CoA thioester hydrolase